MDSYDFVNYQWDYATGHSTRNTQTRLFRYNFGNPQDMDLYRQARTHDWQDEVMGNNPLLIYRKRVDRRRKRQDPLQRLDNSV